MKPMRNYGQLLGARGGEQWVKIKTETDRQQKIKVGKSLLGRRVSMTEGTVG